MRVPEKIRSGENFKSAFLRWSDKIVDYLNATKLVGDHKTTAISQTASGTVIKALRHGGTTQASSKAQDGMFKVTLDSETNKLSVTWDHYSDDDGYAGIIYLNLNAYMFPEANDITPSAGWLCIKIKSNGSNKEYEIKDSFPPMTSIYYAPISVAATIPVEVVYYPIAKIYLDENSDNEETWKIYQLPIYQPPHLFAFGTCDEEYEPEGIDEE